MSRSESRKSFFRSTERGGEFRVIIGVATLPQDIASSSVWSFPTPVHPAQCVNNPNSHPLDFFPLWRHSMCVCLSDLCCVRVCVCMRSRSMFVCAHISPKEENQPEPKPQESVASSYPAQILPFTFDEGTERRHPLRKERGVTQNTHTLVATSRPAIIVWAPCVRPAGALIKGGGGAGQLSQGGEKKATNDSIYLSIDRRRRQERRGRK